MNSDRLAAEKRAEKDRKLRYEEALKAWKTTPEYAAAVEARKARKTSKPPPVVQTVFLVEAVGTGRATVGATSDLDARLSEMRAEHLFSLEVLVAFPGTGKDVLEFEKRFALAGDGDGWFKLNEKIAKYIAEKQ